MTNDYSVYDLPLQELSLIHRAHESNDLLGKWILVIQSPEGLFHEVSVSQLLDDPVRYHGLLALDPLPEQLDDKTQVGRLHLMGVRPTLMIPSRGLRYSLHPTPQRIELEAGKSREATDRLLDVLRRSPDYFDFGSELVRVCNDGKLFPLDENRLRYFAGGLVQFYEIRVGKNNCPVEVLLDPPGPICRNVISLGQHRNLKKLMGVVTAPTLRPDGSILDAEGYDEKTQLILDPSVDVIPVPNNPTRQQALAAIETLLFPFENFPFCTNLDRAVLLAALLTAAVRPALSVAPGFGFDAPIQGSGKTLLAQCIGIIVQNEESCVWPHVTGRDDEEIRKRLFTVLRAGVKVLIWDNILGAFDSAAMAACMTSSMVTDRILGQSTSSSVPNRLLVLLTGNNLVLQGELPRRFLVCRIDPQTERPFAREFSLDPFAYCRDYRQKLITAALTLIRAYLTHGCSTPISGRLASFEAWDEWVRRTVIYANELMPGMFGDVMDCITANQAVDPVQEVLRELLTAWERCIGQQAITVASLVEASKIDKNSSLRESFENLPLSNPSRLEPKAIGKFLGGHKGRVVAGLRLEIGPKSNDRQTWRVRKI
jgi:hypothetical protein